MAMTNKQYQGFIRSIIALIDEMLKNKPNDPELSKIRELLQTMLEDGN